MKLVYIAGPYTAETAWGVEENIREAEKIGLSVARAGFMPVIVHTMCRYFHMVPGVPVDRWIDGTMEIMRRCDAVLVVPDWHRSKGTVGEIEEANRLGIPVFFGLRMLCEGFGM